MGWVVTPATSTTPPATLAPSAFLGKLGAFFGLKALCLALVDRGRVEQRARRLPALNVALLVLASALHRDLSLPQIILFLGLSLPDKAGDFEVSASAITQARQRLGSDALRLANQRHQQQHLASLPPAARWRGLLRLALDGSSLLVPDTRENRAFFGSHFGRFGASAFPLARLLTLFEVTTRCVVDLVLWPFDATSEMAMTPWILPAIPRQSLLLMDAGFFSAFLLWTLTQQGASWLLPLRSNATYRVLRQLGPGDWQVEFAVSKEAKKLHPELPRTLCARVLRVHQPGWRPRLVATSLLDPFAYPAAEVAQQYGHRWQAELGFGDQKTRMMGGEPLRSQTPELVEQEVGGMVLAYNGIKAAGESYASQMGVAPGDLSFVNLLNRVKWQMVEAAAQSPARQARLDESTEGLLKPRPRTGRRCKREAKSRKSKFSSKKAGWRSKKEGHEQRYPFAEQGEVCWA